jgi:hypothetical protein
MASSTPDTDSATGKSMTLRLSADMTGELELVARIRGIPMTHVVRLAVARHLAGLSQDEVFQAKLQQRLEDERSTLERFARPAVGRLKPAVAATTPPPALGAAL